MNDSACLELHAAISGGGQVKTEYQAPHFEVAAEKMMPEAAAWPVHSRPSGEGDTHMPNANDKIEAATDKVKEVTEKITDKVHDLAVSAVETAGALTEKAGRKIEEAGEKFKEAGESF